MSSFQNYLNWKKNVFAERGFDEYGVELEKSSGNRTFQTRRQPNNRRQKLWKNINFKIRRIKSAVFCAAIKFPMIRNQLFKAFFAKCRTKRILVLIASNLLTNRFLCSSARLILNTAEGGIVHALRSPIDGSLGDSINRVSKKRRERRALRFSHAEHFAVAFEVKIDGETLRGVFCNGKLRRAERQS